MAILSSSSLLLFLLAALALLSKSRSLSDSSSPSNSSCQCLKRPLIQLVNTFKIVNQPDCILLETLEAGKVPCTKRGQRSNSTMPSPRTPGKKNSTSVPFHVVSWDTRCLTTLKRSTECFGRRKRECTWTDVLQKVRVESGEREIFPAHQMHVNCEGCGQESCLASSGSCYYQQNMVRFLPLVKTGKCAEDGYEEWTTSKTFRLVNAACSCIYQQR